MLRRHALAALALLATLLTAQPPASSDVVTWPPVSADRLVATTPDAIQVAFHGSTGCPGTGDWETGALAVGTDGVVCVATLGGSPGTWVAAGTTAAAGISIVDSGGNFAATDVEAALAELAAATVAAADVTVTDSGELLTATDVEGALAELAGSIGGAVAAEDVTVADTGELLTATNVEAALAELAGALGGTSISLATVIIPGGDGNGNVGNLFSFPVTLVADPGDGAVLVPVFFVLFYDWGSAAYDGSANPDKLIIQYADGALIAQSLNAGASGRPLLNATADWLEVIRPGDNANPAGRAVISDPIELTYADADPFTAAGDSSLTVITGYYTITP